MATLSLAEVRRIADVRAPWCVTVYGDADAWLGSDRPSAAAEVQIRLVARALTDAAASERVIGGVRDRLEGAASSLRLAVAPLGHRPRSVGIFVTPEECDVFPLTTDAAPGVTVSDRFDVAPLVDAALSLTSRVFVLAASEDSARLIDVTAHPARSIDLEDPPAPPGIERETESEDERAAPGAHLSEEAMTRLRVYAEALIRHVAPVVQEAGAMLAIAAAEPLASMLEANVILHSVVPSQILPLAPGLAAADELDADQLADLAAPVVKEQTQRAREAERSRLSDTDPLLTLRDIASMEAGLREGARDTRLIDTPEPGTDAER
ncbi:hypothetical protein [Microbacterium rhizosphaerae]|uniref:Uncharacterized protein n=1 Tax=Microbacterium rhizosphaerae TaxID=1678237 RepID=A0ABZ0SHB3_9MICO|nr:hypothetical protein [Microbacterium rhizosphaerae]WPR88283.1 hypothetical protein SM116_10865 [Microbacterium rhizosphaerae]